jgi:hypothetical protein
MKLKFSFALFLGLLIATCVGMDAYAAPTDKSPPTEMLTHSIESNHTDFVSTDAYQLSVDWELVQIVPSFNYVCEGVFENSFIAIIEKPTINSENNSATTTLTHYLDLPLKVGWCS